MGYGVNDTVSLEAELGVESAATQGDFSQVDTRIWTLSGNVLYNFAQRQFTPYVALGFGVVGSDPDLGDGITGSAYNFGAGFKGALNDRVALRADIRYINGNDQAPDFSPDHWRIYGGFMILNIGGLR